VRAAVPGIEFLLVGPREDGGRSSLSDAELESVQSTVRYLGFRTDVPALLAAADIVVLPTYGGEGVPRVLMEAQALGRPVIATDVPGCRDVVQHELNGLLIPPADSGALANAIQRLAQDAVLRDRLGAAGIERTRREFDLGLIVDQYVECYESLCRTRSDHA
jgi:glycosyltransferase involved in cell wall biosynthesis